MKLTQLNINKINVKDIDEKYSGQDILFKFGELYQYESGIYGFGNLWIKLQQNVQNIIIEELDKIGCIEVQYPILQPRKIWDDSVRWDKYTKIDNIMYTSITEKNEYAIAPTAEECSIIFAHNRIKSYKSMPAIFYQIGEKFRKEIRPRGYLFRPRTFIMMDGYSFDVDEKSMELSYERFKQAHFKVFERLGLKVVPIVADNGSMGGKKSEEWQTFTELGEDTILYDEKMNIGLNLEILDRLDCKEYLKQEYGIENLDNMKEYKTLELGHNFQLGTKYSDSMGIYYQDEESKDKPYHMGCYSFGVSRITAVIIENSVIKDKNGKIKGVSFPMHLAPYLLQIVYKNDDISKEELAYKIYDLLESNKIRTILDDRTGITIGSKIKDCFLLGCPYLVVIGDKANEDRIEIEDTKTGEKSLVSLSTILDFFKN